MTKYTATLPDGRQVSRNSKRTYTHIWACIDPGGSWGVGGYAGSEALACKARDAWQARCIREGCPGWQYAIIPVETE
jgi:hypothetical protein